MPEYDFTDERTGEPVVRTFSMVEAPTIGSLIKDGRRALRRVASSNTTMQGNPISGRFPVAAFPLPRWLPGCKHTRTGVPIIRNKAHSRHICAKYGYHKEGDH